MIPFTKKTIPHIQVLTTTLLYMFFFSLHAQQLGLVISPVADLTGRPIAQTDHTYATLPVAGSDDACPRMHQLLFNETVEILKETDNEYQIGMPNLFYITRHNNTPQSTYWADKKTILPYTQLAHAELKDFIPQPIDFRQPNKQPVAQSLVVLKQPWHSRELNIAFSAGTRFVAHGPHTRFAYNICVRHPQQYAIVTLRIPKQYALLHNEHTPKEARSIYNSLLKSWAHTKGFIPYVWGGCSFTYTHPAKNKFNKNICGTKTIYTIQGDNNAQKHGFDCAGLIARAAQAAGIPYYYKNTTTLATYLKPVATVGDLNEGDLIWIPGHVMAVGSLKQNTLIEARHYSQGYGRVHEISLNKVFKHIHTFADLFLAAKSNTALERLDFKGNTVQTITQFKILAFIS